MFGSSVAVQVAEGGVKARLTWLPGFPVYVRNTCPVRVRQNRLDIGRQLREVSGEIRQLRETSKLRRAIARRSAVPVVGPHAREGGEVAGLWSPTTKVVDCFLRAPLGGD